MTDTPPSSSYDWIREIKPGLKQLDSIPLTGATPPFPWNQLSAKLAQTFDREGLTIQPGELTWRAKEELYEGRGIPSFPLVFSVPSLRGEVCWTMAEQEMATLATLLLTKESHDLSFQDPSLVESFFRFFSLEVLYNFTQISFDKKLVPILTNKMALPEEDSLCLDISLSLRDQTIGSRLIISPEFRRSWVEYFAQQTKPSALSQKMAQAVDVLVHVEAGKTQLTLAEWKAVQIGDYLLLDSCSLNPDDLEGRVMLTISGKQAFRAKLKSGNLKILELPLFHEVDTQMAKQPENEDEDELSDLDFSEQEDEDSEDFEDEDLFDTEEELFTEDEDDDDDKEIEEQTTSSETEESIAEESIAEEAVESPVSKGGPITTDQIPVSIVIEVGQIQMTVDQLLKLEPGNLLELNVRPEEGVDLTINGKIVGKGELIRIGETLGVRILQSGRSTTL